MGRYLIYQSHALSVFKNQNPCNWTQLLKLIPRVSGTKSISCHVPAYKMQLQCCSDKEEGAEGIPWEYFWWVLYEQDTRNYIVVSLRDINSDKDNKSMFTSLWCLVSNVDWLTDEDSYPVPGSDVLLTEGEERNFSFAVVTFRIHRMGHVIWATATTPRLLWLEHIKGIIVLGQMNNWSYCTDGPEQHGTRWYVEHVREENGIIAIIWIQLSLMTFVNDMLIFLPLVFHILHGNCSWKFHKNMSEILLYWK